MFMDITHYKSKRKGRRGPIPAEGVREASGRLSRAADGGQYMVYFIALEGGRKIKVGRTKNIKRRINSYRHSSGCEARCLVQLLVGGLPESIKLERAAIDYLQTRYDRSGREWFEIPETHLASAISDIIAVAGVEVEQRGAPGTEKRDQLGVFEYAQMDTKRSALGTRKSPSAVY